MTLDELKKFCLDNAGKIVSGKNKRKRDTDFKTYTGRLLAYAADGRYVLVEQASMALRPGTLDKAPYEHNGWVFVVGGACHLGAPCLADSVIVNGTSPTIQATPLTPAPEKKTMKQVKLCKYGHERCVEGWCYVEYAGWKV